jgi:hypothetical protein
MSITITIVTTANRTRRFTQTDPVRIGEILDSLKRCTQLFSNRSLIVVSDNSTDVFSPSAITRIEIETDTDLTPYLPPGRNTNIRALALGETPPAIQLDDLNASVPADFFFEGGDTSECHLDRRAIAQLDAMPSARCSITRLFEQPVIIPYQPTTSGYRFDEPIALMTRSTASALPHLTIRQAGTWHVKKRLMSSAQEFKGKKGLVRLWNAHRLFA